MMPAKTLRLSEQEWVTLRQGLRNQSEVSGHTAEWRAVARKVAYQATFEPLHGDPEPMVPKVLPEAAYAPVVMWDDLVGALSQAIRRGDEELHEEGAYCEEVRVSAVGALMALRMLRAALQERDGVATPPAATTGATTPAADESATAVAAAEAAPSRTPYPVCLYAAGDPLTSCVLAAGHWGVGTEPRVHISKDGRVFQ